MEAAAYVEATFYSNITRLQETAEFAKAMGHKRLGFAFCIGMNDEMRYIARFFEKEGYEVSSACCKTCSVGKNELGLKQVRPELEHEAMCNLKIQARFLNEALVDLYICVGLSVVHDAIFNANYNGPVTTPLSKTVFSHIIHLEPSIADIRKKKLGIMDEGQN